MSALGDPDVDVVGGSSPLRGSKASRILEKTMREIITSEHTYVSLLRELQQELKGVLADRRAQCDAARDLVRAGRGVNQIISLQTRLLSELQGTMRARRQRVSRSWSLAGGSAPQLSSTTVSETSHAVVRKSRASMASSDCKKTASPLGDSGNGRVAAIAVVFSKYARFFNLYLTFVNSFKNATKYLNEQGRKGCYLGSIRNREQLAQFYAKLILPIQRVPRYVLLLKELQKRSRDLSTTSHAAVTDALRLVQAIASKINSDMEKSDNDTKMVALSGVLDVPILEPFRKLIRVQDGLFSTNQKVPWDEPCKLMLFNDVLIAACKAPVATVYLAVTVFEAKGLPAMDIGGSSDPYARVFTVYSGPKSDRGRQSRPVHIGTTVTVSKSLDPVWCDDTSNGSVGRCVGEAILPTILPDGVPSVLVKVFDKDFVVDDYIGQAVVQVRSAIDAKAVFLNHATKVHTSRVRGWYDLKPKEKNGKGAQNLGTVRVEVVAMYQRLNDEVLSDDSAWPRTADSFRLKCRAALGFIDEKVSRSPTTNAAQSKNKQRSVKPASNAPGSQFSPRDSTDQTSDRYVVTSILPVDGGLRVEECSAVQGPAMLFRSETNQSECVIRALSAGWDKSVAQARDSRSPRPQPDKSSRFTFEAKSLASSPGALRRAQQHKSAVTNAKPPRFAPCPPKSPPPPLAIRSAVDVPENPRRPPTGVAVVGTESSSRESLHIDDI